MCDLRGFARPRGRICWSFCTERVLLQRPGHPAKSSSFLETLSSARLSSTTSCQWCNRHLVIKLCNVTMLVFGPKNYMLGRKTHTKKQPSQTIKHPNFASYQLGPAEAFPSPLQVLAPDRPCETLRGGWVRDAFLVVFFCIAKWLPFSSWRSRLFSLWLHRLGRSVGPFEAGLVVLVRRRPMAGRPGAESESSTRGVCGLGQGGAFGVVGEEIRRWRGSAKLHLMEILWCFTVRSSWCLSIPTQGFWVWLLEWNRWPFARPQAAHIILGLLRERKESAQAIHQRSSSRF